MPTLMSQESYDKLMDVHNKLRRHPWETTDHPMGIFVPWAGADLKGPTASAGIRLIASRPSRAANFEIRNLVNPMGHDERLLSTLSRCWQWYPVRIRSEVSSK